MKSPFLTMLDASAVDLAVAIHDSKGVQLDALMTFLDVFIVSLSDTAIAELTAESKPCGKPGCVCHILKPKIAELIKDFRSAQARKTDQQMIEEAAAKVSVIRDKIMESLRIGGEFETSLNPNLTEEETLAKFTRRIEQVLGLEETALEGFVDFDDMNEIGLSVVFRLKKRDAEPDANSDTEAMIAILEENAENIKKDILSGVPFEMSSKGGQIRPEHFTRLKKAFGDGVTCNPVGVTQEDGVNVYNYEFVKK